MPTRLPYLAVLNFWLLLFFKLPRYNKYFCHYPYNLWKRVLCNYKDPAIRKNFFGTMALHYSGVPLYSKKLILHVRIGNLCSIFQCTLMNYPYPSPAGLSLSICQWRLNCTVTSRDLFLVCTSFLFSLVRHQLILQEQRVILKCLLHCHLIR